MVKNRNIGPHMVIIETNVWRERLVSWLQLASGSFVVIEL